MEWSYTEGAWSCWVVPMSRGGEEWWRTKETVRKRWLLDCRDRSLIRPGPKPAPTFPEPGPSWKNLQLPYSATSATCLLLLEMRLVLGALVLAVYVTINGRKAEIWISIVKAFGDNEIYAWRSKFTLLFWHLCRAQGAKTTMKYKAIIPIIPCRNPRNQKIRMILYPTHL